MPDDLSSYGTALEDAPDLAAFGEPLTVEPTAWSPVGEETTLTPAQLQSTLIAAQRIDPRFAAPRPPEPSLPALIHTGLQKFDMGVRNLMGTTAPVPVEELRTPATVAMPPGLSPTEAAAFESAVTRNYLRDRIARAEHPVSTGFEGLEESAVSGAQAMTTPSGAAMLAGATVAPQVALPAILAATAPSVPDAVREVIRTYGEGDVRGFTKAVGDLGQLALVTAGTAKGTFSPRVELPLSLRAAREEPSPVQAAPGVKALESGQPITPTEPPPTPGAPTAPQPTAPIAGGPNASSQPQATEVHGNLRPQPVAGAGQVPVAESGGGVQPQPGAPDTGVRAGDEAQAQAEVSLANARLLGRGPIAIAFSDRYSVSLHVASMDMTSWPEAAIRESLPTDISASLHSIERFRGSPAPAGLTMPGRVQLNFNDKASAQKAYDYFAQGVETPKLGAPSLTPAEQAAAVAQLEAEHPGIATVEAPTPPAVEEIEPFGTVRQFRVTREFYNPADKGTYKVGDIITEPQLTKAGIAVPPPATPIAPGPGAATAATDFGPEKPLETSVKNAVTAEKRATHGMPAVEEEARRAWGTVWDDVKQQVADDPGTPDRLVESLRDRPRAINDRESAMLLHQQVSLEDQFNKTVRLMTDAAETGGDRTAIPEYRANLARISDKLLELYNVDKTVGRETARGLNARKMAADETYSLVRMQLAKRAVNDGRPLSPEESAAIKELHDKIAATQKAFDEHVAKSDQRIRELEAQHAADELKIAAAKEAKADAASGTVRDLDAERASIVEGITRQPNTPLRDLRPWIRKLALNLVRSGITERDPLINAVHDVLKDIFPNVTLRETMDAVSGYGDFRPLDPEAAKAKLRDLSGQMQNVAKLEDLLARKALKKTGPERKVPSNEERRLTKLVNEYKRRYGVVVTNPAAQLKSALDAIKMRLTHDIADLEYQIGTGKKIVKGATKVQYDAEATALLARRDALKEQFDAIFGNTELTDEQRVGMAKAALEKSVAEYERRIAAGETRTPKTPSKTPVTEQLQVLRDQRDALRGQLDELRNADTALQEEKAVTALNASITDYELRLAAGDFAPKPEKPALETPILDALRERRAALAKEVAERRAASPEGIAAAEDRRVADLQAQIADLDAKIAAGDVSLPAAAARPISEREAAFIKHRDQTRLILQEMREQAGVYDPQRIAAANKALDAAIEEAVRQINEGDLAAKSGKPRLSTPELDAKRAELADLQKIKRELRNAAKPKRTPEEVALAALKTRILNENFDLHRRITEGDFTKRTRTPVALDAAAQLLKAENLKLREQFQRDLVADRLKHQSRFEAGQDLFLKLRRASLLSSPVTLAKLTAAALTRMVSTPLEELVGAGIGKLPGYSELAARAPVEGGFSTKAEAKALTTGFMRGIKGSAQILKTGKSDLERVYGRMGREGGFAESDLLPRSWLDWFGELHGALKEPVKQMAFERAMQKQIEFGIRNGIDVTDPTTLNGYALNAYKAGRRAIFLQDNVLVSKINGFLATKLDPATGRPTPGSKLLSTTGRTLLPIVRVPTNIVAETMEYATGSVTGNVRLARALRRGIDTLPPEEADLIMRQLKKGSIGAAMLLTGYLLPEFIGGYYQPHEKRDPGDVKVGEIGPVPKSLLHSPLLEALQVGSTVRRVAESSLTKRHPEEQGTMTGIVAAAIGLGEEVPAVREMLEVVKAFDPRERGAFFGELGKSFVPQLFQAIARQMDKDSEGEVIPRKPGTVLEHIETGIPGLRQDVPEPKRASR